SSDLPFHWVPTVLWWPLATLAARCARLVTVGTLPAGLRGRLGLPWSGRDERALSIFAGLVRILAVLVPPPLRIVGSLAIARWATRKGGGTRDRKSTRLNSSHVSISYAVLCLKKIKKILIRHQELTFGFYDFSNVAEYRVVFFFNKKLKDGRELVNYIRYVLYKLNENSHDILH